VLLQLFMPVLEFSNIAACEFYASLQAALVYGVGKILSQQVDEEGRFVELQVELLLQFVYFVIFFLLYLH